MLDQADGRLFDINSERGQRFAEVAYMEDGEPCTRTGGEELFRKVVHAGLYVEPFLPDLTDPATLGCIEHGLLPDAWGLAFDREEWHDQHGVRHFRMCVHLENGSCRDFDSQVSIAEALIAALEAAP